VVELDSSAERSPRDFRQRFSSGVADVDTVRQNMRGIGRGFWADLRYGARLLVRNPGFAAAAVSSLALGIGANTALFRVTDALMLRTLPVQRAEDIVRLRAPLSFPAFRTIRDRTQTLAGMCAFSVFPVSVRIGEDAEQAIGADGVRQFLFHARRRRPPRPAALAR
jgi:hypothetical protein